MTFFDILHFAFKLTYIEVVAIKGGIEMAEFISRRPGYSVAVGAPLLGLAVAVVVLLTRLI